jgi:hypothetical protein
MTSPAQPGAARNGARRANLFFDPDVDTPVQAATPAAGAGRPRGRGRGLVIAVEDAPPSTGTSSEARFTRASRGLGGLPPSAQRRAAAADRNAQRLLERIARQRYGALIAFVVVAALLLAISWVGLSLRSASADRARLQDQRAAAARSLTASRAQTRALTAERDRARRAAVTARTQQDHARSSIRAWQAKADRLQQQLARARTTAKHNTKR